jgi:hypothetical protein
MQQAEQKEEEAGAAALLPSVSPSRRSLARNVDGAATTQGSARPNMDIIVSTSLAFAARVRTIIRILTKHRCSWRRRFIAP